jgi:hypothetical protein
VEKLKQVTDNFSSRLKNVEDHIEKVLIQQVAMNRTNIGFISAAGHVFRSILDRSVIHIPHLLYVMY